MGKILGSWSGIRKFLEQEMLADCLHGRVRYNCTSYVGMDGCHIFEIYIDNMDSVPMKSRLEYTDNEFCDALEKYRNQSIKDSINSEYPIERMFAVLDRRIGKRTLAHIKESLENQPEWLQLFYCLRLDSENI